MKVLFNTYPMAFHTPGGGEIQLLAFKKYLQKMNIRVSLYDLWQPNLLEHDIVHFFSCMGGSSNFCGFVKQIGLPLVVSSSLWITDETKHMYPVAEIRHQLSIADRVIANSKIECETLSRIFELEREKFATVYNGVDDIFLDRVSPEVFRQYIDIKRPFILNVGNIEPRKNQLQLAKAIKEFPNLKLVLIGHVRDREYEKKIKLIGGEQLRFIGPLPHESDLLRSAYAACELFCLPSTLETPGLAALEANTVGKKIIITEEGSTREYFGDNVEYVNPFSTKSLINAIAKILDGKSQEILESPIKERGFTWKETIKDLIDVYSELL